MHKSLIRTFSIAALLLAFASATGATDLRGRVDARNPYTGLSYPRGGARVQLTQNTPSGPVVVRSAYSGSDGMYYFPGIAPGNYMLVVNEQRFPLVVNNQPFQDVPVAVLR